MSHGGQPMAQCSATTARGMVRIRFPIPAGGIEKEILEAVHNGIVRLDRSKANINMEHRLCAEGTKFVGLDSGSLAEAGK